MEAVMECSGLFWTRYSNYLYALIIRLRRWKKEKYFCVVNTLAFVILLHPANDKKLMLQTLVCIRLHYVISSFSYENIQILPPSFSPEVIQKMDRNIFSENSSKKTAYHSPAQIIRFLGGIPFSIAKER